MAINGESSILAGLKILSKGSEGKNQVMGEGFGGKNASTPEENPGKSSGDSIN